MARHSSNSLQILYEDADVVAVSKPAGLATIPGRGESTSLLEQLAAQLALPCSGEADPRLRVVHRLDKDTSGVLIFAKNAAAQKHLSHQFQNNTVEKEYLALVAGKPQASKGEIDAPIGVHPGDRKRMAVLKKGGRRAHTLWMADETFRDFATLRIFPKTGKTHQIRVHLAHIGLPLAIDPVYGSQRSAVFLSEIKRGYRAKPGAPERPLIGRLTLHAARISVAMPGGASLTLACDSPKDFSVTLAQLRKHARR